MMMMIFAIASVSSDFSPVHFEIAWIISPSEALMIYMRRKGESYTVNVKLMTKSNLPTAFQALGSKASLPNPS